MAAIPEPPTQVGSAIPAHTPHAVSVMFPTWQDNVYYEEGDPRVTDKMECGYPRFFIHPLIKQLGDRLLSKFGKPGDSCLCLPSRKAAEQCRAFIAQYYPPAAQQDGLIRIVECNMAPQTPRPDMERIVVHLTLFPEDAFSVAKQFWQHAGDIFSSRAAETCLKIMDDKGTADSLRQPGSLFGRNRRNRYGQPPSPTTESGADAGTESSTYLEERYGRNLPLAYVDQAKRALRRRIAGIVTEADADRLDVQQQRQMVGERGMTGLSEDEVFLYPCGMGAIYHAHLCAMAVGDASLKSVCFGFPYTDTLKVLQKWGTGCYFYGLGEDKDIDELEAMLQNGTRILSLFCELPSNPLLKSPDLKRLSRLADTYDFFLVVDETIGNFCNVAVLEWADMVASSLTKLFSGDSNVMGGSLILNPNRKHYHALKKFLDQDYEDNMWCEDAIFLERNSRSFKERSAKINTNTEALCDFLVTHPKVEKVNYPKYVCREHYDAVKTSTGGYGGLFSIILHNEKQASQFYDALKCAKGPSLGTNFTLASPYTILAHYHELDWAESYGVPRHLVRVSIGLEDQDRLFRLFQSALDAIED